MPHRPYLAQSDRRYGARPLPRGEAHSRWNSTGAAISNGAKRGRVIRNFGCNRHFQRVTGISLGIDQRTVNALSCRARMSRQSQTRSGRPCTRHFDLERDRPVKPIDRHFARQRTCCGSAAIRLNRGTAGIIQNKPGYAVEMVRGSNSFIISIRRRCPISLQVAKRINVPDQLIRLSHIAANDASQGFIHRRP